MLNDQAAQERLATLDRRISRLEDIEAIRSLLVTYANACDTGDWDRLAAIYTHDAHFAIGAPFNVDVKSPEAIVTVLKGMTQDFRKMRHKIVNVNIDLEKGSGDAYFMVTMIAVQQNQPMINEGKYRYKFVRADGHWRIGEQIIDVAYLSPASWMLENG